MNIRNTAKIKKKNVQRKGLPTVIEKLKLSEIYRGKKNLFSGS